MKRADEAPPPAWRAKYKVGERRRGGVGSGVGLGKGDFLTLSLSLWYRRACSAQCSLMKNIGIGIIHIEPTELRV